MLAYDCDWVYWTLALDRVALAACGGGVNQYSIPYVMGAIHFSGQISPDALNLWYLGACL